MAKTRTKSIFIGLRLTAEQAAQLAALQQTLNSTTKTDVLLQGLELLARVQPPAVPTGESMEPARCQHIPSIPTGLELRRLEAESQQFVRAVQQTGNRRREVVNQVTEELAKTDEVIEKYGRERSALIQILLELQQENRWLSEDSLQWISRKLGVALTEVYHVATFYKAFSLTPQGRHSVAVCLGTACQVREAPRLLDKVAGTLKIKPGETSMDMRFSLNSVNCLGCCALGPVMVVDGKYFSNPSSDELKNIFGNCD